MQTLGAPAKLAQKRARVVLASGGLEPVEDSSGGAHSVFAKAFLQALKDNQGIADLSGLFSVIRSRVSWNAPQTPEYGVIQLADHDGGDFIFVPRR